MTMVMKNGLKMPLNTIVIRDMLILVSSSGESKNMVNAAKYFKKKIWVN